MATGFTFTQPGSAVPVDVDQLLFRRDAVSAGNLWGTGNNTSGQLGNGSLISSTTFGAAQTGPVINKISSGFEFIAAISSGTIWMCGNNGSGQMGNGSISTVNTSVPTTLAGITSAWLTVSCGAAHAAAIKTDGTLCGCGGNTAGTLGDNSLNNKSTFGSVAGGGIWKAVSCRTHTLQP